MIPVKWFLKGTAGVLAYGLVCAGPPDTMMATPPRLRIGFRQGWWGATWFRCVPPRAQAHLAHSARAPTVAHQTCLVRMGPQVCLARVAHLAPASRTWGPLWFTEAAHPKTIVEHAEARVLLMCWEGGCE